MLTPALFAAVCGCLLLSCAAQAPSPPKLPTTFVLTGQVERHRGDATMFGDAFIGYDSDANMGVTAFLFPPSNSTPAAEILASLERYDKNSTYLYRQLTNKTTCTHEPTPGMLPPFFHWVSNCGVFMGTRVIRHVTYDYWAFHGGLARMELHIVRGTSKPGYINMQSAGEFLGITVSSFSAEKPNPDEFAIPNICSK